MNRENIAYALGQVDEEYIVEAASSTTMKVRKYRSKWGAIAACLTLTVILVASVAAATGMLDPILSYFQSEEEIYMEEILAPSYSVSNEKVQLRLEGASCRDAILEAGSTRIRPILMTTLTTILGLLDMAAQQNIGTTFMQPVAAVCIGGLTYATLMTLFIVPIIYEMMNKKDLRKVDAADLEILDI